ncbi:MAG: CBS domain-containing protein [Oscillospiraceae bacterium]|nr:CBS domain-containing protein [Oscillospiraceae bacterium]
MKDSLRYYSVEPTVSILEALKKIDSNQKGFLVVVDARDRAIGTITDGDIRRAFIRGKSVGSCIDDVYNRDFTCIKDSDDIMTAAALLKKASIKFLPIVNSSGELVNIITKNQMHTLLLMDIHADLSYDFRELDNQAVNEDAFQRPWGFYKTMVLNDYFQSKVISVRPKEKLSLQSHNRREEHWIVAHGVGTVQVDEIITPVCSGTSVYIPKGAKHRLTNTDDQESLIVVEVQIGDYFGEDDIIRYEDTYGRA